VPRCRRLDRLDVELRRTWSSRDGGQLGQFDWPVDWPSTDQWSWLSGRWHNTTGGPSESVLVGGDVNRTNYTALIGEFYDDFEHVSETYLMTFRPSCCRPTRSKAYRRLPVRHARETYLMTTLALLGIVLNTLAMLATCSDRQMRRMSRSLHCVFFAAENLFLSGFAPCSIVL